MIKFEFDSAKAAANVRKRGVSFEEAQSVFHDEFSVQFFDEDHSGDEERFLLLGMSTGARLLLVCHCELDSGNTVRIISARPARPLSMKVFFTEAERHESPIRSFQDEIAQ